MRVTVVVRPKDGILDPQGEAVERSLRQLGFGVRGVRVGRVVDLEVDARDEATARREATAMCDGLLANPLIESYELTVMPSDAAATEDNEPVAAGAETA